MSSEEITSLEEDRIAHNATLTTQIFRSDVFQIQPLVPSNYYIEKITGSEVIHWTENRTPDGRHVTLHSKPRTAGDSTQYLTLSASGIREQPSWNPLHIKVVNASKQRGTLTLSPGLDSLIKRNAQIQSKKLKNAEILLKRGNELAQEGKRIDAKRALESAYNLSLNEDARVQWNNLRIQQTMVGLTSRRSSAFNQNAAADLNLTRENNEQISFSSSWADQVLQDNNSAEENRALSNPAVHESQQTTNYPFTKSNQP